MGSFERLSLIEYGQPKELVGLIADHFKLLHSEVRDLLLSCGGRAGNTLNLSVNPLSIAGDMIRAEGIAGLLCVAPGIEIEIAPKFLGLDSINQRWREDFFFLATLSRHGRLLASENIRSSPGRRGDLHILVARAMTRMFWENHRRPLRTYHNYKYEEFALDGEVDLEEMMFPGPNGFKQSNIVYDKRNPYNATILAAAENILPNLRDPSSIAQLERMIQALAPQQSHGRAKPNKNTPSRAKRWQLLYDLSRDVLKGFGLTFISGRLRAPGYLLNTWRVWEDFLRIALRMGLGVHRVSANVPTVLGTRQKIQNGKSLGMTSATVTPDLMISEATNDSPAFLVDAKYKGHIEKGALRITESDLYESLAFSKATNCKIILLAYPAPPSDSRELGSVEPFERIIIDSLTIIGVEVETKGISLEGGLIRFANHCAVDFRSIVNDYI